MGMIAYYHIYANYIKYILNMYVFDIIYFDTKRSNKRNRRHKGGEQN